MKIGRFHIRLHSMFVHFSEALFPVAMLFLVLYLLIRDSTFLSTYFYLLILATLSIPPSLLSGVLEWKQKYSGARTRIFLRKIRYGIVLLVIGAACCIWFGLQPCVLDKSSLISVILFLLLNLSTVPITIYLGHLGGKLVFGFPH